MQIKLPNDFEIEARRFFAKCGFEPTNYQMYRFTIACLQLGFEGLKKSHDLTFEIIINPIPKQDNFIPSGGICPDCKKKIVIGQDLKKRCNCRIW